MWVDILRKIHRGVLGTSSQLRLLPYRFLGLRVPWSVRVGKRIQWPIGNLKNIKLGDNVSLGTGGWIYLPLHNRSARIQIDEGTAIGDNFTFSANDLIHIGRNCLISYRVSILDHDHVTGHDVNPVTSGTTKGEPVIIGENTFLGTGVVIMRGVTLGKNCVVNANSVVMRSFEDYCLISGSPAKVMMKL
jgi:acetyltransferase-like isoleucine patch superfamily enzyme